MVESKELPNPSDPLLEIVGGASSTAGIVRIDGVAYDATDPASFSLRTSARARAVTSRIKVLEDKAEPTEGDEAEYFQRLGELITLCVPGIPEDVLAKLAMAHRRRLTLAFFARVVQMAGRGPNPNGTS